MEGVNYMRVNMPAGIYRPNELFDFLKDTITYKNDPKGVELVHSPQSFYEDNYWKKSGYGDCDDFTVIGIAALKAIGVPEKKIKIKLTGRRSDVAKHIYLMVENTPFDLTNDLYGEERQYPFYQEIALKNL